VAEPWRRFDEFNAILRSSSAIAPKTVCAFFFFHAQEQREGAQSGDIKNVFSARPGRHNTMADAGFLKAEISLESWPTRIQCMARPGPQGRDGFAGKTDGNDAFNPRATRSRATSSGKERYRR